MKLEDIANKNIKKLKEEIVEIKNVIYEMSSLVMEMPFTDKPNSKIKLALCEKCRDIYEKSAANFEELNQIGNMLKEKEFKKYVKQLNIYMNVVLTYLFMNRQYIMNYTNKYSIDTEIQSIQTYYLCTMEKAEKVATKYEKYIKDLGEGYYV